jgi:tetratricopeptide (TPR) repeat protein
LGKRRKQKPGNALDGLSSEKLASQANELITAGKYRKARDAAKILFKRDAEIGRPILFKANRLLAEEMLAKGQESEAKTVIDYLHTIGSPEELSSLARFSATISGNWESIGESALTALTASDESMPERDRHRLADEIITSFTSLGDTQDAIEARAIQTALKSVSDTLWDEARDALRKVPRRSPFAHWTLFIKGLIAFHCQERSRAKELFARLPAGTVPDRAAIPWRTLLEESPPANPDYAESTINCWCQLAGETKLANSLPQAEKHWRKGDVAAAYDLLKRAAGLRPESTGIAKQLFELFMSAPFILPQNESQKWLSSIGKRLERAKNLDNQETEELQRAWILHSGPGEPDDYLETSISIYLKTRSCHRGADPEFEARVHLWVGTELSRESDDRMFGSTSFRNPPAAIRQFKEAISKAPDWVEPYQQLCKVYEKINRKKEHHRLVDKMTGLFPSHKETLIAAGRLAKERKSYLKAITLLEKAQLVDPLDASIQEELIEVRMSQVRTAFDKRQFPKARDLFDKSLLPLANQPFGGSHERWWLLLFRSLLEEIYGSAKLGQPWLDQSLELAPGVGVLWFARVLLHDELISSDGKTPRLKTKYLKLPKDPEPTLENFECLLNLIQRRQTSTPSNREPFYLEDSYEKWLKAYLRKALQAPFNRSKVAKVFERLIQDLDFEELASGMARQLVKSQPTDPLYGLFSFRSERTEAGYCEPGSEIKLDFLHKEAELRGDRDAMRLIEQERRAIQHEFPSPFDRFEDDFFDEDDDDDDDIDFGLSDKDFPGAPPELMGILSILADAPDEVIEQMKKTRPEDMSSFVFDTLVKEAKKKSKTAKGPSSPPKKRPSPPKKAKVEKPIDPSQMDLF